MFGGLDVGSTNRVVSRSNILLIDRTGEVLALKYAIAYCYHVPIKPRPLCVLGGERGKVLQYDCGRMPILDNYVWCMGLRTEQYVYSIDLLDSMHIREVEEEMTGKFKSSSLWSAYSRSTCTLCGWVTWVETAKITGDKCGT